MPSLRIQFFNEILGVILLLYYFRLRRIGEELRGPRISYPHAVLHVINRFVDRHPFFQEPKDFELFLDIYFEVAKSFGMMTYAYCLMPNHFHIVLETPSGELSKFLQRFLTKWFFS